MSKLVVLKREDIPSLKEETVGFMEHSGVNPRSQVDVTELCSVKSTCDDLQSSTENLQHDMVFSSY